jgi:hypothetical protein
MRAQPLVLLALVAGCGWNNLPDQEYVYLESPLWDPVRAVPTVDGLYLQLPGTGGLTLVRGDGTADAVDLGDGQVTETSVAPDNATVVAFLLREQCVADEEDDCAKVERTRELVVLDNGEVSTTLDVEGTFNDVAYSTGGEFGIAYLDLTREVELDGVTNLTSVVVHDLQTGDTHPVGVGFAAEQVLFVENASGASKAVVVSANAVAVIDLLQPEPFVEVTFPLTLDPDGRVVPVGVDLTPDGRYALISAQGSSDLYTLDLQSQSINIVDLSAQPSDMAVNATTDHTVLVYGSSPVVEVLDHDLFDVDRYDLDLPMDTILQGDDFAVLFDQDGGKDVYRLDIASGNLVEYVLENPPLEVVMAPGEEFAVALTRAEGGVSNDAAANLYNQYPGLEIIDLRSDDTAPYILEGAGLGVAFSRTDTRLDVLVLQEGIDYLYQLDLYTGEEVELELTAPPSDIGVMPDGTFYITHPSALGLVTFYDAATGETVEASGFATRALLDPYEPAPAEDDAADDEEAQ